MKLVYFVHDLTDPAVARRVKMLRAGGAQPLVLGFRREATAPREIEGAPAIDLGRTYDGRLAHRAGKTALQALTAWRFRDHLRGAEVIMARTLEMLAVAAAARATAGSGARLIYECLDIHRLMLSDGAKGRVMRAVERRLMRRADLLVVSSPAFIESYFAPLQGVGGALPIPTLLVENKVLELEPGRAAQTFSPPAGPPWRIGWLGAIRCRRSLDILADLAARRPDLVEVTIHGRPAYTEFDDFDGKVAARPNLSFRGSYRASDLARLYSEAHFAWAIDYMEEGLNSAWLLPNRLYEASGHGAVPIALKAVQTGRWLDARGLGLTLDDPSQLEAALQAMTVEAYGRLRAGLARAPRNTFFAGPADARALVEALAGRVAPAPHFAAHHTSSVKAAAEPEHSQGEVV